MLIFKNKKTYEEFIRAIGNGLTSDTFEGMAGFPNLKGFEYLVSIRDKTLQSKVMRTLKFVDQELNYSRTSDEMYKKIEFFLKVGILYGEYNKYMSNLTPLLISTLATELLIPFYSEYAKNYIPVCASKEFLEHIRKNCQYPEYEDALSAVCEHYDERPFDVEDKEKLKAFQQNELNKFLESKKNFLADAKSLSEVAKEVFRLRQQ